jgi:Fic family protein
LISTGELFSREEKEYLETENGQYLQTKSVLEKESPTILKREWERFIIEFSWKSSEIEGNTYSLLETEALLKESQYAEGKDRAEAQMILNHKKAFEYILVNQEAFSTITVDTIKRVHALLVEDLGVKIDFRDHPVGITGTLYRPPEKQKRIEDLMKQLVETVQKKESSFEKALLLLAVISYIQPFEDGNKRTARMVANAFLYSQNKAMLSYRSVSAVEYKKAILLFYEKNNISALKRIFTEQFAFAVKNYFL